MTTNRGKFKTITVALSALLLAPCLVAGESIATTRSARRPTHRVLRLADRFLSVAPPVTTVTSADGLARMDLEVTLTNRGHRPFRAAASDFASSAHADFFAVQPSASTTAQIAIAPRRSHVFHLSFTVPKTAARLASLFYRPTDKSRPGVIPLNASPGLGAPGARRSSSPAPATAPTLNAFVVSQGVGDPWGTATDAAGNIWFAEPGCDFAPTCPANAPPGQIGVLKASSHAVVLYALANIPGNQPSFLTFDSAGKLWFTTPNNDMIGEFDPSTGQVVGQWSVTPGSGPWDLTIAGGKVWYTEHLVSAVGAFDPSTHASQDFQTPSANSSPYGIAASGGLVWFTENNSSVDRVAVLDTAHGNAIAEYPIVAPKAGTPHLIAIDGGGHPWWTEGWANTIATLNPAAATAGQCGTASGTCAGIQRFRLPASAACPSSGTHVSGIAIQGSANLVWLDNSLRGQVGSFSPTTGTFALSQTNNCNDHPHDGLILDAAGNVWFDEQLANAIGELIPGPVVTVAPQGTWVNQVGTSGFLLGGWNGTEDVSNLPGITASLTHGDRKLWASNTSDVRALQAPDGGSLRNAAAYIDPNRVSVKLGFQNGYTGNLSLYALDWDNQGRRETISVDDGAGMATVPLNSGFASGAWATFSVNVRAGGSVTIDATSTAGPSAVLSAVMVGGAGAPPLAAAQQPPQGTPVGAGTGGPGGGPGAAPRSPATDRRSAGVTTGAPGTATVGHVRVAGTVARVLVRCSRAAGAKCKLTLVLTATSVSKSTNHAAVAVGTRTVTLTAGSSTTVTVPLNDTGRRLLSRRRLLRARLTITQATPTGRARVVSKRRITFEPTRRATHG